MSGPFHVVLRNAIQERGLPLERLRSRLAERGIQIGLASLSDWQHGRAWPQRANSLRAIDALEGILGLPSRTLTDLLAGRRTLPFQPRQGVDEYSGPISDLLDELPGSRAWELDTLTTEHIVTVDAQGNPSTITIRSLVRARRDGVDRFVVRYFGATGCVIDRVTVRPVRNCHTGRVLRHSEGRVMVSELLFGQPLRAGETWIFETEIDDPTAAARSDFAHGFRRLEGNYLLEVRFHPTALPSSVHGYLRADLYTESHRLTELGLNSHHAVHLAATNMTAGVLGISWEWPTSAGPGTESRPASTT
jgi:hypothetical protein